MLKRPTEQQCYDIIKWSVQYLRDYGMHENALFRESKSQHDIRSLKAQICEGRSRRQLGDLDCHVVGGVLVSALKDMPNALLFEIQENLQEAADLTDGTDECLDRIAAYLSLLPPTKIEVVRVLFTYLHDLAAAPANDANVVHLMIIFAPLFCRPDQTAHMSIRHVEMLRQLRPLLQMMLDNNHYIMRHVVANPTHNLPLVDSAAASKDAPLRDQHRNRSAKGVNLSINIGGSSTKTGSGGYANSDRKEHTAVSSLSIPRLDMTAGGHSRGGGENVNFTSPLRLNLGMSMDIDPDTASSSSNSSSSSGELNSNYPPSPSPPSPSSFFCSTPSINIHSWEWKLLDSLVSSRVETLVHKSDLVSVWDSSQRKSCRKDLTSHRQGGFSNAQHSSSNMSEAGGTRRTPSSSLIDSHGDDGDTEMEQDEDDVIAQMFPARRLNDRRALMAECKQLRQDIQHFEERWISEYKRSPKAHERGNMQQSYARYKDIKKAIRDNAATDIQRVLRGYISRQTPPPPSSPSSGPMELEQQQQDYIQQSQFSHLQKRPASADGYHSPHHSSPLAKVLASSSGGIDVSMSTSLPLTRSVSDEGAGKTSSNVSDLMLLADSKSSSNLSNTSGVKLPQQNAWLSHDQDSPAIHHATSKSHGGGNSGSKYSDETNTLCQKYQEALESKKQLKKMLKKFDDDFVLKKGRAPKKVDKEVMRPQYQKYHEVRGDLEKLKTEITKTLGHFPKELEESKAAVGGGDEESGGGGGGETDHSSRHSLEYSGVQRVSSSSSSSGGGRASDHTEDVEGGDDDDDVISGTSISASTSQGGGHAQQGHGSNGAKGTGGTHTLGGLDELNHEKKHLHLYLKAFEKEFNRANGRHVMHPEDILPVAKEYQRYKELKKILKDYRASSSSSATSSTASPSS